MNPTLEFEIDPTWLVAFVNAYATSPALAAAELGDSCVPPEGEPDIFAELTEDERRVVANRWFRVFEVAPHADHMAEIINEQLALAPPTIRATANSGMLQRRANPGGSERVQDLVTAAGALVLLDEVERQRPTRFGICGDDTCQDAYIDRSPRANRVYCSLTCQTRMRVRRHRNSGL